MLSAWIAEQGLHCTLNIGFFESAGHVEPKAWGILLADLVRHIGNALAEDRGTPAHETIAAVVSSLQSELDVPTSAAVGDAEVVRQAGRIADGLIWLWCHELKGCALPEFEVDVPAAVEGDLCTKVLDVKVTGFLDLRCGDAGGQRIGKHGDSLL